MKYLKRILIFLLILTIVLLAVFLTGRYGWKLVGFNACETAGIEQINVEEDHVRIRGFYPGSFPRGFLGYHAEQVDHTLYVGFKFSALFGIFETGDFDITIPTKGTVTQVVVKGGDHEYSVWPREDEFFVSEAEATENGIYVHLERSDVYSVSWYFENKSGGMTNADNTALEVGKNIYLDNDVFYTASNLERPVPVMLTFSDKEGKTIAQANLGYDPESPVLTATLTADARIYVNGIEVDEPAVPAVYEPILQQYRTALGENWTGQQLVDAGLNFMIRDVPFEAVGYAVDDLDDNGVPELIIGTISTDDFYGKLIFVLYTVDDGEPVQIFSSIERNRYYYAGGTRFANIGSSGADSSYVTTVKLEGEGLVDMTFTTAPKDYVQMAFVPVAESMENSKITPENAEELIYEGEYASYDTDEPMLYIQKNEDGTYSLQIGIYRLIQLDKCVGIDKGDRLAFSTVELGENQEITGTIILNGEVATVTLYAPWSDTWFKDVNEFDYYKLNVGKQ